MMKKMAEQPHRASAVIALFFMFLTVPLSAAVVVFSILGLDDNARAGDPTIDITAEAVQAVHQSQVPHTDINGNLKQTYGVDSFMPIGIYNPTLCQVTYSQSWGAPTNPPAAWNGEYRFKVHYGSSRGDGTYTLADINVGTAVSGTVGNLPPNTNLYYSIWLNGTSDVVKEGSFTSTACLTSVDDDNFKKIGEAGYNTAILEKNIFPDSSVLDKANSANIKLILDMRDRQNGTFSSLKDNSNIAGFYVGDDDLARIKFYNQDPTAVYSGLKTFADGMDSQTSKVVIAAEPDIKSSESAAWQDWYRKFDVIGNVSFHYNYPKSNSPLIPWRSISDVADTVKHQVSVNGSNRPSWFIAQAINLKWVIPLEFPTAAENRAMVYTALVHGATGIFQFSHDGWLRRQPKGSPAPENQNDINWYDRHAGIKKTTPTYYEGGDKWNYSVSSGEKALSEALWNGIDASSNGINKELQQLKPVILSPTASDSYQVYVDAGPISQTPVRTVLKKYQGAWYLLAVNIDNASINAKFVLPGAFSRAEVLFENRDVSLSNNNQITDLFSPFDVNVYKLYPKNTMSNMVESQRQVCALYGTNQSSLGIGGMDGGTSVKVGADSFFTFGDNTNLSSGLFLPNSIVKTNDTDAGDCMTLTNKTFGGVAQALLPKVSDELLVWPDGMLNTSASMNYFYYMSVRGCAQPEPCASQPLGAWKVRGIGLAKLDTTSLNSTRVGNCSPITGCLFWKEGDTSFEIAGATAYKHTDGYVYVFLNESTNGVFQDAVRLARVGVGSVENKAEYQYWNGTGWIPNIADSSRVMTFAGGFNGASIAYNTTLGKWTAIYTTNNFSAVSMRTADSITGPWSTADEVLVDCDSVFSADKTLKCYFGRQHTQFEKNSGKTIYVTYANQKTYKPYLHEIVFKTTSAGDSDGDGCTDAQELGTNPALGGDRNPNDPWDFYDVNGDKRIDLSDVLDILGKYGIEQGFPGYDPKFDRYSPDAAKPYRTAAATDGIDLTDALVNLESFGHGCE